MEEDAERAATGWGGPRGEPAEWRSIGSRLDEADVTDARRDVQSVDHLERATRRRPPVLSEFRDNVSSHWDALGKLVLAYAGVRLYLLMLDLVAARRSFNGNLDGPILGWDSWHYLQIAAAGYPATAPRVDGQLTFSNGVFGPLFPLLIRLGHDTPLSLVGSAVMVSLVGGLAATLCVWRLAASITNEEVGLSSALIFVALPGMAVAWGVLYSECVGLAFAAASLLLMTRRRWVGAGVLGVLAALTSPICLALAAPALARALVELRRRRVSLSWATVALIPGGFLLFAGWLAIRYHDALFWWHLQQQGWGTHIDFGRSFVLLLSHWSKVGGQGPAWMEWIALVVVAGGIVALVLAKLPLEVNVYCAAILTVLFVTNDLGFKPRLLMWAFPMAIAAARVLPRTARRLLVGAFLLGMPVLFILYTTMGNSVAQP
jgi:hypothetical protein